MPLKFTSPVFFVNGSHQNRTSQENLSLSRALWSDGLDWLPDIHPATLYLLFLRRTGVGQWHGKSSWGEINTKKRKRCIQKQNKKRNSFTTSHQQADVQLLFEKQGLSICSSCLGRQVISSQMSSHHPCFPQLLFMSIWASYGIGYPFGCLGQLSQLSPLPACCLSPAYRIWGVGGEALTLCENCLAIAKTLMCYLCYSSHSCKAAVKKVSSIPARTSTKPSWILPYTPLDFWEHSHRNSPEIRHTLVEAANNFHLEFKVTQDPNLQFRPVWFCGWLFSHAPKYTLAGLVWLYTWSPQSHIFSEWPC